MSRPTPAEDLTLAVDLATRGAKLLVDIRSQGFAAGQPGAEVGRRGDVTSNQLILAGLAEARPDDSVLSEESADDLSRLEADRVWIIDPLDGTREYSIPGRTDWAVHVALWQRGAGITAAAVALPALDRVLTGHGDTPPADPGRDAATDTATRSGGPIRTVVSESRPPAWLAPLGGEIDLAVRPMGSAGAKAMAVVTGEADAYVHSGGQYEWDSAAPVGVTWAAGLHASRLDGSPLRYNLSPPYLPDLIICRPELAEPLLAALARIGAV